VISWFAHHITHLFEVAIIWCVNTVIQSLADLANSILAVLPNMPTFGFTVPSQVTQWYDYGAYWFPVGWFITNITIFVAVYLAWLVAAIPLRWAKAIPGDD
jgi:hypothetical protein